ncbi:MAG: DUF4382 domain-containing protein [Pseudomonadota bacterium]
MKNLNKTLRWNALAVLSAVALTACGGGGGSTSVTTSAGSNGSLRMALTDAPACGYDAVNVTVQKVRVHQSSSAADADSGWSEITLTPARRIDLLSLTNGVLSELGQTPLPTGRYTQLRLVLADNTAASPFANSVVPTSTKTEVALKTPSGQQSGVKANIGIDIAANQMADFVLDFDACKSVVAAGNSGQYLLKPVVSVIPRYTSGASGFVDPAAAAGTNLSVSLQQNGVLIKTTVPDSTGKFLLQPVAPGSYTLVMAATGRTTIVVTGIVVATDTVTALNTSATAINPPVAATATVSGTSTTGSYVRALQTLSAGATVEVTGRNVDDASGGYSFTLPVNAPLVGAYAVAPNPLVLSADVAATGKYTIGASLTGFTEKQTVLIPLTVGAALTSNFVFP